MGGPKKQDFCNVVTRFQGFHLIFLNGGAHKNEFLNYEVLKIYK
jgi:hypothetical protein